MKIKSLQNKPEKFVFFALFVFLLCSCHSGEEKKTIKTQNSSPDIPLTGSTPHTPPSDSAPNISSTSPLPSVSPSNSPAHVSPPASSGNISRPSSAPNVSPPAPSGSTSRTSPPHISPPPYSNNISPPGPAPPISPLEEPPAKAFSAELLPPPVPLTEEQKEEIGIVGVIRANKAGSDFCNQSYLPRNSITELRIQWSVNGQGKMAPIYVLENPTNNKELAECFTTFLSRLEYPKSLEGDTTTFIQTFVFSWK